MNQNQTIKETLDVIRKALEDDIPTNLNDDNSNILILKNLVKEDGTINVLEGISLTKKDTTDILKAKLDEIFESYLSIWLDKNIPNYLEKYINKKD